jgi:rod shape determining protein RodA
MATASVFDRPSLWRRISPLLTGFDGPLAFALFLLGCVGLVTMYSTAFDFGGRFVDHGRNMLLAGFVMFVVAQIPPQRLMALAVPLYVLGVALLVAVAVFGITKKGARRWLNVGVVIQPSEIMKIAMPLMLAWWFQKREGQLRPLDFLAAGALLAVPAALIMKQPDLGTALLVLAAGLSVILFAGLSWKLIVPPVLVGWWASGWWCFWGRPLRRRRALAGAARLPAAAHLHPAGPHARPAGQGLSHHPGHDRHRLRRRLGQGLHAGHADAPGVHPRAHHRLHLRRLRRGIRPDWRPGLIAIYSFLVLRALVIALEAPTLFSRLLAGAVAMIFFSYAFVNMGMVSGILPVVGVPLPFISYGGTAMLTLGLGLGILMSIAKSKRLVQS